MKDRKVTIEVSISIKESGYENYVNTQSPIAVEKRSFELVGTLGEIRKLIKPEIAEMRDRVVESIGDLIDKEVETEEQNNKEK
jgi:hypothetical protein